MKRTDYAQIADIYDQNEVRRRIAKDEQIEGMIAAGARPRVLDLACGTGNYLVVQREHFGDASIRWFGVDASKAMLRHARAKLEGVDLREGRAEALPYDAASFEYVTTRFAFHHFEDKPRALDEVVRVLAAGGTFRVVNVAPERMPGWWIYRYFPSSRFDDDDRFWSIERLAFELERRELEVDTKIEIRRSRTALAAMLADAERRELSQLVIVDDASFAAGIQAIRERAAPAPGGSEADEIALVELTAKKRGR